MEYMYELKDKLCKELDEMPASLKWALATWRSSTS